MKTFLVALIMSPLLSWGAAPAEQKVEFKDAQGKSLGTATLTQFRKGVKVNLDVTGLKPGTHAIHFHENGKCEGPGFESAGEHYNPTAKQHGMQHPEGHHVGDLPNITAAKNGSVKTSIIAEKATLATGPGSLDKEGGVSLVIHELADDNKTQPSGASGGRIACAILDIN